jgi:hypothetical protein
VVLTVALVGDGNVHAALERKGNPLWLVSFAQMRMTTSSDIVEIHEI